MPSHTHVDARVRGCQIQRFYHADPEQPYRHAIQPDDLQLAQWLSRDYKLAPGSTEDQWPPNWSLKKRALPSFLTNNAWASAKSAMKSAELRESQAKERTSQRPETVAEQGYDGLSAEHVNSSFGMAQGAKTSETSMVPKGSQVNPLVILAAAEPPMPGFLVDELEKSTVGPRAYTEPLSTNAPKPDEVSFTSSTHELELDLEANHWDITNPPAPIPSIPSGPPPDLASGNSFLGPLTSHAPLAEPVSRPPDAVAATNLFIGEGEPLKSTIEPTRNAKRPHAFHKDYRTVDELRARPCQANFPYTSEEIQQYLRWDKSRKKERQEEKAGESSRGRK